MLNTKLAEYIIEFQVTRDYFECHEIGEEEWKCTRREEKQSWLNLIQIAVAMYHWRANNKNGAIKILKSTLVSYDSIGLESLGINSKELKKIIEETYEKISNNENFIDIDIPIKNNKLLNECLAYCKENNLQWLEKSNLNNPNLIYKHKLRDRTEVIKKRLESLKRKRT